MTTVAALSCKKISTNATSDVPRDNITSYRGCYHTQFFTILNRRLTGGELLSRPALTMLITLLFHKKVYRY